MMDDVLEKGEFQGGYDPETGKHNPIKYKRDPYAGEDGEVAEDQPVDELTEQARTQVLCSAAHHCSCFHLFLRLRRLSRCQDVWS